MAHQLGGESNVEKGKDQEDRHANVPVYESERRRCGRRSNGDLHRRAGGSRSPTGAVLLDVHRRPARRRRLVEGFEDRGFTVLLVNARHVKNVPGRKSDVSDCQWMQYLHSVGLLRGSFRPDQEVCTVRSIRFRFCTFRVLLGLSAIYLSPA